MATPKMMSVELAIQRELAYRRRMETLQFGLHHASSSASIPFQDLPSISGTKRKSPYMATDPFPPQQPHSRPEPSRSNHHRTFRPISAKISCTVCIETFPNIFYLEKHLESQKHQRKMATNKQSHVNTSNPFMCEICQVTISSRVSVEEHLKGRRHKQNMGQKQNMESRPAPVLPRYPHVDFANLTWESV